MHVQGYPGMSSDKVAKIWARVMDYEKMIELRQHPDISPGNENEAVIKRFPECERGFIEIPYEARALEEKLGKHVPELRLISD